METIPEKALEHLRAGAIGPEQAMCSADIAKILGVKAVVLSSAYKEVHPGWEHIYREKRGAWFYYWYDESAPPRHAPTTVTGDRVPKTVMAFGEEWTVAPWPGDPDALLLTSNMGRVGQAQIVWP